LLISDIDLKLRMLHGKLREIGFTPKEEKVYLELLKLGPQAVSVIAKKCKINRSSTYAILSSLERKGVVSSYKNGIIKFFCANDPNTLVGFLDRKCRTYDYYRNQMMHMVPKLRKLNGDFSYKKPVVTLLEGIEGIKQIIYDTLKCKSGFRACMNLSKWFSYGLKEFLLEFKQQRSLEKEMYPKLIVPETDEVRAFFSCANTSSTLPKFMDRSSYEEVFKNELYIYNNSVSMVYLVEGNEYGVQIENPDIATMQKIIFDMAYESIEERNSC